MATKSYSKHKEYREYSNSSSAPGYTDEQFDMMKADLLPKGSKLNSLDRTGGTREYHYEYKEEKLPSGKYDRKDMHSVELVPKGCKLERSSPGREYCYNYDDRRPGRYNKNDPNDMFAVEEFTVPPRTVPKNSETNTYYYEREERELPAVTTGTRTYNYESSSSSTPGYSKVKTSKATKDLSHNVEELDSLLDDLQKDQERQLYKSGYTSDTAESTSFDYRKGTPIKAPSSGYSTLKREEHVEKSSWSSSPPPPPSITRAAEVRQEVYREEKTESRVIPAQVSPAVPIAVPQPVCHHCHHVTNTGTLSRTSTPMNKVTTTVKTYTYEVPADQDPTTVPLPTHADTERTYLASEENTRTSNTLTRSVGRTPSPSRLTVSPPPGGCQYCSHCNTHIREYNTHVVSSTDVTDRTNERVLYPRPANEVKLLPSEPHNGHGPHGPTMYKYSETTYSASNTNEYPRGGPRPGGLAPSPSPAPFPRPTTPSPGNQQTPKKLDDLLADFPEARFPAQADGLTRRKVEATHEAQSAASRDLAPKPGHTGPTIGSKNIAGPAVYYPPGHTPFAKKDTPAGGGGGYEASSAVAAGGGRYAAGRGMYEYEAGSRSKEKHSETKTAVPICLPLCCAMPCVIM